MSVPVPEAAALSIHFDNSKLNKQQGTNQPQNSGKINKEHHSRQGRRGGIPRPFCDYCDTVGHHRGRCYKLHGYPSKKANAVSADSTHHQSAPPLLSTAQYNKILS